MTGTVRSELPGLDLARLEPWFRTEVAGVVGPLRAELIVGGKSNLTYRVTDGTTSWVVRRPPLGHVLATAHDMSREFRVLSALQGTAVPVPPTRAMCDDPTVLGARFYVMDHVPGTPFRRAGQLTALGATRTRAISLGLVDALARLHNVDPASVGLDDFGRPANFLHRQVRRWRQQLDASRCRDLPAAVELHAGLSVDVPVPGKPGIVHGDYRLDNVLVDDADQVVAIVDWEMSTVGDPLTDLALLAVYTRLAEIVADGPISDASSAAGFLGVEEMIQRYAGLRDCDLSRLGYYLALAAFKLAVISEGIHYRFLHGQTVGPGFDRVGEAVQPLLEYGLAVLRDG